VLAVAEIDDGGDEVGGVVEVVEVGFVESVGLPGVVLPLFVVADIVFACVLQEAANAMAVIVAPAAAIPARFRKFLLVNLETLRLPPFSLNICFSLSTCLPP
jgi:hypothetical protein